MTCQQIADEIGCARTSVLKYLHIHGIPVRSVSSGIRRAGCGLPYGVKVRHNRHVCHKRELENIDRMRSLREEGMSCENIARKF